MQARRALAALSHAIDAVRRQPRPRVHDDERGDALGVPGSEPHRVVPSHGVADQRHAVPPEVIHQGEQVGREVLGGVGGRRRPRAGAVPALIERDHMEPIDEGRNYTIEPVRVSRAAVKKTQRRRMGGTRLEVVQIEAIYADFSVT